MKEVLSVHDIIDSDNYISPKFRSDDNIKIKSNDDYYQFYKKSIENIGDYWAGVASELYWFKKWDINMHGDFPDFKFFLNGYSNVCFNCIDRHALKKPDKTAIIWLSEDGLEIKMDYRSLMIYTSKFASYLRSIGIKKGDVVAIFMPNRIESFIAVHACYRIGAIYNIIFSGFSTKALLDRLYETMPKVIITADKTVRRGKVINIKEKLDSIINNVKSIQKVIVVKRFVDTSLNKNEVSFEDVLKETNDLIDPVHIEANEPGFVIYTSGTTSRPKGIVHSGIGFMVGAYHNVKYALDLNKSDVYWCTADIGWLTFPIFELVGGLAHGATVVAYEGALDFPGIDNFYNTLEKYKINKLFKAPTFLRMLARYGNEAASKYNIKLDLISLVGEPLDTKTW
ncbi:acetyl-coenzyme A synthetase [Picrophilus oshimae DSM 9789]|uniref:Acetyl-coenzyme A synthetase n=1 Tax=Picrophilus torridus (strain ATCC 700027 / DSM 9790 / JCM 10055 / NBRC 100828 / KAW 2/3) TaxID=1122961 RepID=Q6L1R5_PICTO|nr:acetyl-coenzyme A synthetase [Picrophilus oshimae DSM 9789]